MILHRCVYRIAVLSWIFVGATFFTIGLTDLFAADGKKPNVLFLFTDDMRADCIGALGNPHIKTPNLDLLANSGMVFRNAYCLGGNSPAVCLPSRNMLLSGRAYFRFDRMASGNDPNFPDSMRNAGYFTYHHGKRGNTAIEIQKKFHLDQYVQDERERNSGQPGKAIVDRAIQYVKSERDERPFFMYLAFDGPHDPRVAAQEYLDLYRREEIPLPANYLPVHPFDNGEMTIRDERLAPWPRTEQEVRRHLHEYYAVISGMDYHIGRLIKALKETGEFDNTIIVFSSDHGLAIGSHGLMGKQNLYEDGMKAPLIFSGPGIPKGDTKAYAYLLDIFPTVLELIGMEVPAGLDGKSLLPVIQGQKEGVRDSLFLAYRDVQRAVRNGRWKLIRYPLINKNQLFDLEKDPHEITNLADDPAFQDQIRSLLVLMQKWQVQLGDKAPLTVDKPRDPTFVLPQE